MRRPPERIVSKLHATDLFEKPEKHENQRKTMKKARKEPETIFHIVFVGFVVLVSLFFVCFPAFRAFRGPGLATAVPGVTPVATRPTSSTRDLVTSTTLAFQYLRG